MRSTGWRWLIVLAVVGAAVVVACGEPSEPASGASDQADPVVHALRTVDVGPDEICAGVGLAAVLHGDPADSEVAWLGPFPAGGGHSRIVFPTGYRARFEPVLAIVDPAGRAVMREGDFVDGGCVIGEEGVHLLMAPFPDFRLECGPMGQAECTSSRVAQASDKADSRRHPVATIRFLTATGKFEVLYEDGTTMVGFTSSS